MFELFSGGGRDMNDARMDGWKRFEVKTTNDDDTGQCTHEME